MDVVNVRQVAEELKRSPATVRRKARRLGLGRPHPQYGVIVFTPDEVARLAADRRYK